MNPNANLILHIIIYGIINETDNPTKAVQEFHRKLKYKLSEIRDQNLVKFNLIENEKKELYSLAWEKAFGSKDTGAMISLGSILDVLYPKLNKPLVGKRVIERASSSFYYSKDEIYDQTAEIEANSNKLSYNILDLLGFEQNNKPNSIKKQVYNTLILEGKIK